jgi:hypothetical protein
MSNVKIGNLEAEITLAVQQYTESVAEAIKKEIAKTAKAVLEETRNTSPVRTGKYKAGWKCKKETADGQVKYTIHNKNKPWLVHLLEFGHAKKSGGRVSGRPHLQPAYDKHVPDMEERIKKIIESGG